MPDLLTPDDLVKSIEAGLLAERKRYQEASMTMKEARTRIWKAERLLKVIRRTFNLPEPERAVFSVGPSSRPLGIEVLDETGARLYPCDACSFVGKGGQGLAAHKRAAHAPLLQK